MSSGNSIRKGSDKRIVVAISACGDVLLREVTRHNIVAAGDAQHEYVVATFLPANQEVMLQHGTDRHMYMYLHNCLWLQCKLSLSLAF